MQEQDEHLSNDQGLTKEDDALIASFLEDMGIPAEEEEDIEKASGEDDLEEEDEDLEDEEEEDSFEEGLEESDEDLEPEDEEQEEELEEEEPPKKKKKAKEKEEAKTYKVKGKDYTLEELVQEGLIEDLVTQSEQVRHYQSLYEEEKSKEKARLEEQQRQEQLRTQEQQRQLNQPTPAQIRAQIKPQVDKAVEEGWFDEHYANDYPAAAASQMFVYNEFLRLKQLVHSMYHHMATANAKDLVSNVNDKINTILDGLAVQHEAYATLADADERSKFREFLDKVDPHIDKIDQDFLARQFLAFQHETILQSLNKKKNIKRKVKKKKRKQAAGEGGNQPRSKRQKKGLTDDEQLIESFLEDAF